MGIEESNTTVDEHSVSYAADSWSGKI